jgi:hypothetical protein
MSTEATLTRAPVDVIAQICHEANRVIQAWQNDPTIPVSPPWVETDEETRSSATQGVIYALGGATPEESHENWCRFKREHGWVLGPEKDEAKKTHPLLVPYEQLPEGQKTKDALFTGIVRAMDMTQS